MTYATTATRKSSSLYIPDFDVKGWDSNAQYYIVIPNEERPHIEEALNTMVEKFMNSGEAGDEAAITVQATRFEGDTRISLIVHLFDRDYDTRKKMRSLLNEVRTQMDQKYPLRIPRK